MSSSAVLLETVDVFETVLVRMSGRPESLFLALGRLQHLRSLTAHSPEVFAEVRRVSEQVATEQHVGATRLDHIYAELAWRLALDARVTAALAELELELERRLLRPVPRAAEWVSRLREPAGRVAYVSDTYLSSDVVRGLLEEHGLWADGDALYVSCEVGASKWHGGLFTHVAQQEGLRRQQLRHHGNHARADIRSPRRRGVQVSPATRGNPSRYEDLLEDNGLASGGLAAMLSGAARMARLEVPAQDEHAASLRDVGAGVIAPALTAYLLHVLRHAERTGVRRLYFAARDGEVMLRLARPIAGRIGSPVELRYLYGSRQAWNAAALTEVDDDALDWILQFAVQASLRMVLARVGVTPEDHRQVLLEAGLPEAMWDTTLAAAQVPSVAQALRSEPLAASVLREAAERRHLMLAYLEQALLLDGTPYGLVDVGWKGRPAAALSAVLAEAGAEQPARFYYFGLLTKLPRRVQADRLAYLFDGGRSLGAGRLTESMATFDVFCSGREGLTIGYAREGDRVVPVLRSPLNEPVLTWGLATVRGAVDSFARHLVLDGELVDLDADARPAVLAVLREFFEHPTEEEARAWGAYPHSSDQNEADSYHLARPVPLPSAALAAATGLYQTDWNAGSRRLSPAPSALLLGTPLRVTRRLRRVAKRLLRG